MKKKIIISKFVKELKETKKIKKFQKDILKNIGKNINIHFQHRKKLEKA